jgi:hypothetical protein
MPQISNMHQQNGGFAATISILADFSGRPWGQPLFLWS